MGKVRRATVRDIAEAAGVSPATVSLALNNANGRVSESTRAKVLTVAKRLKYTPANAGRPPVPKRVPSGRKKTRTVVFLAGHSRWGVENTIYSQVQAGLEQTLRPHGVDLIVQNFGATALAPGAAGVVTLGGRERRVEKRRLIGDLPFVVCMGQLHAAEKCDHVTYDNRRTGVLAAEYLLARGHRRIGCLVLETGLFTERTESFVEAVCAAGGSIASTSPQEHGRLFDEPENLEQVLAEFMDRPASARATALFIPADTLTALAYPILYHMGILPGRDIDIVSCNNEWARVARLLPRPAEIDIKAVEVGRFAALQLLSRLNEATLASPVQLQIQPQLIAPEEWERPSAGREGEIDRKDRVQNERPQTASAPA